MIHKSLEKDKKGFLVLPVSAFKVSTLNCMNTYMQEQNKVIKHCGNWLQRVDIPMDFGKQCSKV